MEGSARPASWLIAAALTAAVWPALSVVLGHMGSAALGYAEPEVAVLRSAVGFIAAVGGALVMAPALTLALLWAAERARGCESPERAAPVAMGLLWPAWAAGVVLVVPPLVGQGPGVGELLWVALAALAAIRAIRLDAVSGLEVPRRWRTRFVLQATVSFLILFFLVSVGPAALARSLLNVASPEISGTPARTDLPEPGEPRW